MRPAKQTMGARIKALRQAKGWSMAQLAKRSGVHPETVANYERRPIPLSLANLEAIATALNTTPQDLAGWTDKEKGEEK